ncbi:hypothetical protein [Streptomyces sp. CO7]
MDEFGVPIRVPRVHVATPAQTPPALTEALRRPFVTLEQAFPKKSVRTRNDTYRLLEAGGRDSCTPEERWTMKARLSALIDQGDPCTSQVEALYADEAEKVMVEVTVLTFRRPEDAARVLEMTSTDRKNYWVAVVPSARLQALSLNEAGDYEQSMTVRSVILARGRWASGAHTRWPELTAHTMALLEHVEAAVLAHEDPAGRL